MTIVKNVSRGPRGLHLKDGTFLELEPGRSSEDVEISEGELEAARRTGWFRFDGEGDSETVVIGADTAETARMIAEAREEFERRWNEVNDQLTAANQRADDAEDKLDKANAEVDRLTSENDRLSATIAAFDHDGDGKPGGTANAEPASDDAVKTALEQLDSGNDEHWTQTGLPAVDAVAKLAGGKVTRDQITNVAPALSRETAKKG